MKVKVTVVSKDWYQVRSLDTERVFFGYGRTEKEALNELMNEIHQASNTH